MASAPEHIHAESSSASTDIRSLLRIAELESDAPALLEEIIWRRLDAMRSCMVKLLSENRSHAFLKAIFNAYTALPVARQARVLLSSEFCECYGNLDRFNFINKRVAMDDPVVATLYATLLDLVLREQAIDQLESGCPSVYLKSTRSSEVWSPMGDVYALRDGWGEWTLHAQTTIGDVIAIDISSPLARNIEPSSGTLSYPPLEFTPEEIDAAQAKLQAALEIIDRLCPIYGLMIRNFVRRVILRKSLRESETAEAAKKGLSILSSEHAPRQPGSIRILNPHLEQCTVVICVEKLLHESTHNMLAAWETANGTFVTNNQQYRPMSPWSGNQIPNSSFVHATFIYYMCHRLFVDFHNLALSENAEYQPQIREKLATFAVGFLGEHSIYEQLMLVKTPRHDIRGVLEVMQAKMKEYYGIRPTCKEAVV